MLTDQELMSFVRASIDHEAATGYSVIRRIPSTHSRQVVDYVSALEPAERDSLFATFAAKGTFLLRPDCDAKLHPGGIGPPVHRRFLDAMAFGAWQYPNVRDLRASLADRRSARPTQISEDCPEAVIRLAETIQPTKAREIRKVVKAAFAERFSAQAEAIGGGDWKYHGTYQNRAFQVSIDYGGRSDQLRYEVSFDDPVNAIRATRLSYESMLGMGFGWWDFVTATNLSDSTSLLCDLVQDLVTIPNRLGMG